MKINHPKDKPISVSGLTQNELEKKQNHPEDIKPYVSHLYYPNGTPEAPEDGSN